MSDPASSLTDVIARSGLEVPGAALPKLEEYCRVLWQWNERLNLTRHTDYDKFVSRDLVDSLQLAQLLLPEERVLDVGSGGGVPGMLVAILRPELEISLCESILKKASALRSMVDDLQLAIQVYPERAEDVLARENFHTVTARAVGPLAKMLRWFRPHWEAIGRLLVIKGPRWVEERGEARHRGLLHDLELRRVASYLTPGTDAENVILQLRRKRRDG